MGPPVHQGSGEAFLGERAYPGERVSMGNPHLACLTDVPVEPWASLGVLNDEMLSAASSCSGSAALGTSDHSSRFVANMPG